MKDSVIKETILVLPIVLSLTIFTAAQTAGNLDMTFGNGGKVTTSVVGGPDWANSVALQPDGKVVVAGDSGSSPNRDLTVVRYNVDGSLDTKFGGDGKVTTSINGDDHVSSVAIQPDGKIVVAGFVSGNPTLAIRVLRFNAHGALDTTFNSDGIVTTDVPSSQTVPVSSLVIQPDGKIITAGSVVVRYNTNGSLDTTFGNGGMLTASVERTVSAVLQPDGKIVTSGTLNQDFAVVRYNADGSFDTTFGSGGIVTTNVQADDWAQSIALQPDGKMVAGGTVAINSRYALFAVVRYNPDGSLDASFGNGGKVTTNIPNNGYSAVAIQPDGKIIAVGGAVVGSNVDFVAVRYNTNGTTDISFGVNGIITTNINIYDVANSVALQPDGKIVLAGASGSNTTPLDWDFAVVRYYENGSLDTTFDGDGILTTNISSGNGYARSVAVQPDGKIVAAGFGVGFTVLRYSADGTLDATFGNGGKVTTLGHYSAAYSVAIQHDGKIVVGGTANQDFALVRYNTDGSLDTSFGNGGIVTTDISAGGIDGAYSVAIQPDGKIVAAGIWDWGKYGYGDAVVRYNTNGSLDTTFDGDGVAGGTLIYAVSLALQPDGKIIEAGYGGFPEGVAVARYNTNGSLDTTFGNGGIVSTDISGSSEGANAVSIQSDGKIVVAGYSGNEPNFSFAVVRYNANGSLDTKFDGDGIVTTSIGPSAVASSVAIQADEKIVVAGSSFNGSNYDFAVARFNPDGSLNTKFGGDGKATVDFSSSSDAAYGLALDHAGRAVAVGESDGMFAITRLLLGTNLTPCDFDGDGRSDPSVFRPSEYVWYLNRSSQGFSAVQFGVAKDKIVPADYDGDGKTDIAIFRDGVWWLINSSDSTVGIVHFGIVGDVPAPADYTGDGRDEVAVYRDGEWWILDLSNGQVRTLRFGNSTDKPVPADYDGDGKADFAVFRPSDGSWWIDRSGAGLTVKQFGIATDRPVVGDYDGDGKADLAVYRDGTWYVDYSAYGPNAIQWGLPTDIPVPGDYDGDGRWDIAVFRSSEGAWYIVGSTAGTMVSVFGIDGDRPIPSAFIR